MIFFTINNNLFIVYEIMLIFQNIKKYINLCLKKEQLIILLANIKYYIK